MAPSLTSFSKDEIESACCSVALSVISSLVVGNDVFVVLHYIIYSMSRAQNNGVVTSHFPTCFSI